jgi:8-oxo-dGTP pyrophosphatase MutT (NUDIX family)
MPPLTWEVFYFRQMNSEKNPWRILDEKLVYDNPWINLTHYDVINPTGGKGIYGKVHYKNIAIGTVPLDSEGNIYLVGQYRFTLNKYSWEIPAGGGPLGTEPLLSAQRELEEETGLKAGRWEKIIDMHLSNSITDECCIIFLARDLSLHYPKPEETELLSIQKISFDNAYQMVKDGNITDSLTVTAILKVKTMILEQLL